MKLKKYLSLFLIVLSGILIVSQASSLLANYNIVEDINLTTSSTSLKKGDTVAVSVTDTNVEDTKLVIPIDENIEYIESNHQDASVVLDSINHQVVIDWLNPSKEQQTITVLLKMNKEGIYPIKALTVRENQEVSTKEEMLEVGALEENQDTESSTSTEDSQTQESIKGSKEAIVESGTSAEQASSEESNVKKFANTYAIKKGVWGTAPYEFDTGTGELKVGGGDLSENLKSPWKKKEISKDAVKKIIFQEPVNAPVNSRYLFSGTNAGDTVGLPNLGEIINLSYLNTSDVTSMWAMFYQLKIEYLDLSNFNTSKVTNMQSMFSGLKLKKLVLGEEFRFYGDYPTLGKPIALNPNDELTGNWIREDRLSKGYAPSDFILNYGEGDLTAGAYVAETVTPAEITAETNISNQTHSDGLFYMNDEVKIENTIHHTGEVWNFIYKTIIPEELTISDEAFKGYLVTDEGHKIDFPSEVFKFDKSSRTLEVNLKNIVEPDNKGNYYTAVDADFYYDITATINKDAIGKNLKVDTTINYFNNALKPKPNVNVSTESKKIYGLSPQWELKKDIKNISRSDEVTAVGDELEFTITATNNEEFGAMSNFNLAEMMFPDELDFVKGSAELVLPNGTNQKLSDSVYQPDKQIVSANVFSGNGYVGVEPYSLRFKAKVKDTAYGKILETKANLSGATQTQNELTIDDEIVKINVAYSGKLGFKETPKTLSFKESFISTATSTIERKDADWGISIEDTRPQKQPWKLSVKQVTPFESNDGDVLAQVLFFKKNGEEDKGIDVNSEVEVYSENDPKPNDYFISWQKNEGFFLKVRPGTAKAKQYQTDLQWNLKDTPI